MILNDKLALPSERCVSMTFFSFVPLLCIILEESLLKLCTHHHVDPYQFHIQILLDFVISLSIGRSASSNLSLSIQTLALFLLNLKPCNLHLNSAPAEIGHRTPRRGAGAFY